MYSQLEDSDEWFLRHYHCINEAIVMGQRDEGSPTTRLVPTVERLPLAPLPIAFLKISKPSLDLVEFSIFFILV